MMILKVTLDDMLHHTAAVSRVVKRALVVADMPFMSYQVSIEKSITNAGRLVQESGANAVKMEVGLDDFDKVRAVINAGIPVIAHWLNGSKVMPKSMGSNYKDRPKMMQAY